VAVALLVVMAGMALILDRLWLDAADLELTTAAEAAALKAASELANDDLLKPNADPEQRFDQARAAAAWIASQNLVAGDPVVLSTDREGDIRFGRLITQETGQVQFNETTQHPTTAVVTAMRTRRTSNPVGLFVSGVTGFPAGDVATRVEASIDNRVRGVRPQDGAPIPTVPLAIWLKDPAGRRLDTWETQIEARKGQDLFGFDPVERRVYDGSDGIPEILLRSQPRGPVSSNANVMVLDIGSGLKDDTLARQFASGWTSEDLAPLGGELCVTANSPVSLRASGELRHGDREALDVLIGEPRLCLLYSEAQLSSSGTTWQTTCVRMVGIRVLEVRDQLDGSCEIVAQPCLVKTKTAILDVPAPYSTDGVKFVSPYINATATTTPASAGNGSATPPASDPGHPYLYKLQLTH
jgi:hypothetical protein